MIKLIRVDDRLLHGQVAFAWIEFLKLQKIIIVDDEASSDGFISMVLNLSMPKEVSLDIITLAESEAKICEENQCDDNSIIIVGSLFDAKLVYDTLLNSSNNKTAINIGGLRNRPNAIKVNDYVFLTREDVQIIKELADSAELYICRVPSDGKEKIDPNVLAGKQVML